MHLHIARLTIDAAALGESSIRAFDAALREALAQRLVGTAPAVPIPRASPCIERLSDVVADRVRAALDGARPT